MEYRFFYPIDETIFNNKWEMNSSVKERRDIYFILPRSSDSFHIEYGLKLRDKKKFELKILKQRYPNRQEHWEKKTIHTHERISINDTESIMRALRKSNEDKLAECLNSSEPIIVCYVNKFRQQKKSMRDCKQELTGLHLQFIQANNEHQIGHDLFFETACIEQSNGDVIDEKIIEKFTTEQQVNHRVPMGYPEFLFRQYQEIINEQIS